MKLHYLLLSMLSVALPAQAIPGAIWLQNLSNTEKYSMAACAVVGTWALVERYKKNSCAQQRDFFARRGDDLNTEVNRYKNEMVQLENDQDIIKKAALLIDQLGAKELYKIHPHAVVRTEVIKTGSTEVVGKILNSDLVALRDARKQLETMMPAWQARKHGPELSAQAKALLLASAPLLEKIEEAVSYFVNNQTYLDLELMTNKIQHGRTAERDLARQRQAIGFMPLLEQHIHKKYPLHMFAYVTFAESLNKDIVELKRAIVARKNANAQIIDFTEANSLLNDLEIIYDAVILCTTCVQQRAQKPIYEQQEAERQRKVQQEQKRLDADLYAQRAYADEKKHLAERKYLDEQNRANDIVLKLKNAECTLKQCQLKQNEIDFEYKKMSEKKHITEAVDAAQKKFKATIGDAKSEIRQLTDALDVYPAYPSLSEQHSASLKSYLKLLRKHADAAQVALCRG